MKLLNEIDVPLVERLIVSQFPQWGHLPIRRIEPNGWDNRTFRLGEDMSIRLPSAQGYAAQVEKEFRWLHRLAPHLPLAIPTPLEMGVGDAGFPWGWSVNRWIEGQTADLADKDDLPNIAHALADFLNALYRIPAADDPLAGEHNHFRGGPLDTYDNETRLAIEALDGRIDTVAATEMWDAALSSTWKSEPVWVHGDVSASNMLVRDGRLVAVIDFGICGVGDPACDLTIAWTFFSGNSREVFHNAISLGEDVWARARGWALWKALITVAGAEGTNPAHATTAARVLGDILIDEA